MDRSAVFATKIRAALAPCSLAQWPTPLEAQPALARAVGLQALWLKREDLAGGNKVRGLEFLLAGAPPRSVFVTIGGAGSSHCLATARHAKTQGFRTAVAVFPQPETEASRSVAAATAAAANLVVPASNVITLPWAVLRAWRAAHHLGAGRPRWIPAGGADPRAVIGHFLATLEVSTQLDVPPDTIVVPLGTGGTAAGIALGVAWLGWSSQVVAVRVAPRIVANRWRTRRLARQAAATLRRTGLEVSVPRSAIRLRVVDAMGKGYGHPTPEGELARSLAAEYGVRLDSTYGAKAFSFLLQRPHGVQRAVFWHTFSWP
ncbi:MAG TPA: pyridoxal-phosphate dependent enzyme [Gemmatimonadales bacterium]|jgi:1-aminocyclopropane-1-carboxylate deaminase/D-cysteine desulfhydrase-like pyridoxal-dependent ACC family enzyme|nr:pyridoxal-phosphate dependent enzyme [Gemmatimonadales bacterium]